jgi:predicted RNA-binding protein with PUA-like domain
MAKRYWLMKSEPGAFSIDDLRAKKETLWDGVRNFQARNFMMKEMSLGDEVIFYHSNADPSAAVGVITISGAAVPDPTQFDSADSHYDPKATPAAPIWYCVRVKFKTKFARPVPLAELRAQKPLQKMVLLRKGSRLSVQPVTEKEFKAVCALGARKKKRG